MNGWEELKGVGDMYAKTFFREFVLAFNIKMTLNLTFYTQR